MDESLFERVTSYTSSSLTALPFPPTSERALENAENRLGFPIPAMLRACYLSLGNGGYGPGYGLIGLEGGYSSDFGNLVETYEQLKSDQELEGREWPRGLLPFCEWGCNIFSCADCNYIKPLIFTFEDFAVSPQNYDLDTFFELWMSDTDILSCNTDVKNIDIINPFTGEKDTMSKRVGQTKGNGN